MVTDPENEVIATIVRLFAGRGDSAYGGEAVSQREHALQAAWLARQSGASSPLIAAALLHDIGHLLHALPDDAPGSGVDDRHEDLANRWLVRWFPAEVAEPVRLHVDAKRYLCAVEPSYRGRLSEPSLVSLALQGGAMDAEEAGRFRASPHAEAAVSLRRWDDLAKDPDFAVPGLDAYLPILRDALAGASRNVESGR